jgi:hypothetical protein
MAVSGFAGSPAAHFTFPICRTVCLLGTHFRGKGAVNVKPSNVRTTNSAHIARADSQVYASFKSDGVQRMVDELARAKSPETKIYFKKGRVVEE